jgi:hypothetical protein
MRESRVRGILKRIIGPARFRRGHILGQVCPDIVFIRHLGNSQPVRYHCGPTEKQRTHGRETIKPVGRQTSRGARDHSTRSAATTIENVWLCRPAFRAANLHREDRTVRHHSAGSGDWRRVGCNICFSAGRVFVLDPGDRSAGSRWHDFRGFESAPAMALAEAQASRIRELRLVDIRGGAASTTR